MELTPTVATLFIETAEQLRGSDRRIFMAKTVKELGHGGQREAERQLGWNRVTIRKGTHELESGIRCVDALSQRGRKRAEDHLPNLLEDIKAIVDSQSQTDPSFKTTRLYTRLSAKAVGQQLIDEYPYNEQQLPTERTIANKLNDLGYYPTKVQKSVLVNLMVDTCSCMQRRV